MLPRRTVTAALVIAALVCFIIAPVVSTAFLGDDLFNSTVNGLLAEDNMSYGTLAWDTSLGFARTTARFIPVFYFVTYGIFHVLPSLAAYKTFQFVALALCFAAFAGFLVSLELETSVVALAVLCALATVQFHGHFDGYLGFSGTQELLLLLGLATWSLFALALRTGDVRYYIGSVFFYVVALLSYENCYLYSVIHVLIAMHLGGRRAWNRALPFVILSAAALSELFVLRRVFPQVGAALYTLDVNPALYVLTLLNQLSASLPLSYLAFQTRGSFAGPSDFFGSAPVWLSAGLVATAVAAILTSLRREETGRRSLVLPALIGTWLWIEAAILFSAIPRYQQQIHLGYGYIFMVIGGFGSGLLFACAICALLRHLPPNLVTGGRIALAVAYAAILLASFLNNARTIATYEPERFAVLSVTDALERGVLGGVPNGALLVTDVPAQLFNRGASGGLDDPKFFVREHSGLSLNVQSARATPAALPCPGTCRPSGAWALRDVPIDANSSYSFAGAVSAARSTAAGALETYASTVNVSLRGGDLATAARAGRLAVRYVCLDGKTGRAPLRGALEAVALPCPASLEESSVVATL